MSAGGGGNTTCGVSTSRGAGGTVAEQADSSNTVKSNIERIVFLLQFSLIPFGLAGKQLGNVLLDPAHPVVRLDAPPLHNPCRSPAGCERCDSNAASNPDHCQRIAGCELE